MQQGPRLLSEPLLEKVMLTGIFVHVRVCVRVCCACLCFLLCSVCFFCVVCVHDLSVRLCVCSYVRVSCVLTYVCAQNLILTLICLLAYEVGLNWELNSWDATYQFEYVF